MCRARSPPARRAASLAAAWSAVARPRRAPPATSAPRARARHDRGREIRADLFFFASDEMRGRDTPSLEQRVAARFLRARLERLGLRPAPARATSTSTRCAAAHRPGAHAPRRHGRGRELELAFARDYFPATSDDIARSSARAGRSGAARRARRTSSAPRCAGRWAVCLASDLSARRRARYAERRGALGLIVLPDRRGARIRRPGVRAHDRVRARAADGPRARREPVFPQVYLTLAAARAARGGRRGAALPALGAALAVRIQDVRAGSGRSRSRTCARCGRRRRAPANEVLDRVGALRPRGRAQRQDLPGRRRQRLGLDGLLAPGAGAQTYGPMRRTVS
jgi:hypothetical protein